VSEPRPKHLIEGVIPAGGMVVTYGDSGQGKSFTAMDRDMHIAGGKPWCGRNVTQGAVVWVAAEMSEDLYDRIEAVKQHLGLDNSVPFFAVPCPVDLLRPGADINPLIDLIKTIEAEHGVKVIKTTIDTLSRALAGGNENAPDDMGMFVKHVDRIRYECACTVEVIHHTGKDSARGARGHSLLRAATDTEIEVGGGRIKVTKQRTMAGGDEWEFKRSPRRVGLRHDGTDATSCYVETREARGKGSADWRLELTEEQRGWLNALNEAAPQSKDGFSADTAMVIWGLDRRTTAVSRLSTLFGAGHLTKPKGEKGGVYAFADRRVDRQTPGSHESPSSERLKRAPSSPRRHLVVRTPGAQGSPSSPRRQNARKMQR
jgi:hypothetical protein